MTMVGQCKCGASMDVNYPYTWCSKCGEYLPGELVSKLSNTYTRAASAAAAFHQAATAARTGAVLPKLRADDQSVPIGDPHAEGRALLPALAGVSHLILTGVVVVLILHWVGFDVVSRDIASTAFGV